MIDELTPREREVALLAADGLTNRQIAMKLGMDHQNVKNRLTSVYKKTGAPSRAYLIILLHTGRRLWNDTPIS